MNLAGSFYDFVMYLIQVGRSWSCNPEITFLRQTPLRVDSAVRSAAYVEHFKCFSEGCFSEGSRRLARF